MFRKLFRKLRPCVWLAPGFLLYLAFPPFGEKTEVFFALAPLLWLSRNRAPGECFRKWFLSGMAFWIGTLSWMPAIVKNGGPWPLVVLGWWCLAAYCSLFFAAFGYMSSIVWQWTRGGDDGICDLGPWHLYSRRIVAILVAEPVLWAGLELVRSRLFGGFAWNQLGVAPVNMGFSAPAALGGVYLLSAMAVLVNGTIASIAERIMRKGGAVSPAARSLETILPFALVFALYFASVQYTVPRETAGTISAGLVQRNFPCVFKGADTEDPIKVYTGDLVPRIAPMKPDLLILPESAFSEFGALDETNCRAAASLFRENSGARGVIAGGAHVSAYGALYNSAALYTDGGVQIYDKTHLVPFGEYIPGDKIFKSLQSLAPVGSCTPGELKLLDFDGMRLGVAICFEDTDSAQIRELARMGADLLVFITNDSWFSESVEPVQHQWQAVARAVETGLPVFRVGNSGVTGTISPQGTCLWLSKDGKILVDARGTMFDTLSIPAKGSLTPYAKAGDFPLAILFALHVFLIFIVPWLRRMKLRSLASGIQN